MAVVIQILLLVLGFFFLVIQPLCLYYKLSDEHAKAQTMFEEKQQEKKTFVPHKVPKRVGIQFKTQEELDEAARKTAENAELYRQAAEQAALQGKTSKYTTMLNPQQHLEEKQDVLPPEIDPSAAINMDYLKKIAVNSNGTAAGPFIFTLDDGSELTVLRILNPLPEVVALELPSSNDVKDVERIRLPYSRIHSVRLAA